MAPKKDVKRKMDVKGDAESGSPKKVTKGSKTSNDNGITTTSEKCDGNFVWSSPQPDLHVCEYLKQESCSQIASFDLDGTLVTTKTDSPFPKDPTDFKLFDDKLPSLISTYIESGHRFVIFTNQAGVYHKKVTLEEVKERIKNVLNKMDPDHKLPCLVLVAIGDDLNRKPRPGMWWMLERVFNADIQINRGQSFYVGDAAGRIHEQKDAPKKGSKAKVKKDHSASDLIFARNLNLSFVTPEQFLSATPDDIIDIGEENLDTMEIKAYDPKENLASTFGKEIIKNQDIETEDAFKSLINDLPDKKPIVVIMTGLPASGKSTLYERLIKTTGKNLIKVSRDELGTADKCEKAVEKYLKDGGVNIVIDNTSVDVAARKKWINLCKGYDCTLVSVTIVMDVKRALHNNLYRKCSMFHKIHSTDTESSDGNSAEDAKTKDAVKSVPSMVVYKMNKDFVLPSKEEKFDMILHINFIPKFDDKKDEDLYYMFLNDK